MFSTPPSQDRRPERNAHAPSPTRGTPERVRPYLAAFLVVAVLWSLPGVAVQWYAVSIDSGMYSRIAAAVVHIACFVASFGAVYRDDKTAERAVVNADQDLTLRRQLRMVPWGRCAIAYLTMTAVAAPVLIADAHGHEVAFPALSLYLIAGHALWFAPPARDLLRHGPPVIGLVALAVPTGLLVGGMNIRGYWIDDPWCWTSAALATLMILRVFRPHLATWIHDRRQRRTDVVK